MDADKKIDFVKAIVDQSNKNLFKMELDLRFFKKQMQNAKGDDKLNLSSEIVRMEKVIKSEKDYQEYLQDVLKETYASLPRA